MNPTFVRYSNIWSINFNISIFASRCSTYRLPSRGWISWHNSPYFRFTAEKHWFESRIYSETLNHILKDMASLPWKLHIEDKAKFKNKKVLSRSLITKMTLILVGTKPWLFLINIKIATIWIHLRKPGLIKSNIIIDGSDTGNGLFSIRAPW